MHEYSVAMEICEVVLETARNNAAKKVTSIDIDLGELTHINPDQLTFCLEILAKGGLMEGAKLNIVSTPSKIKCDCGYEGVLSTDRPPMISDLAFNLACPECGNPVPNIISGKGINVRNIKIELDD
ncbi:MAG: hydrogenase maturation nickel metallochaperone HypA [Methanocellales archaeon]|nr:hydrogenase maturation nickel metallochaperone HypA [Methanocellales archaeon]MDD3291700.1 hydrogenase maturation nickel metallochaperone HypA [Methanocellales archaeon]MDD5235050.1 hydrogenase maturation nickel metallochaperone HypA [Methanocellales archaeon]MDD5485188.1 hydrogenase maturation nickel metallochaperone HypA [Methanocellales archaeon]